MQHKTDRPSRNQPKADIKARKIQLIYMRHLNRIVFVPTGIIDQLFRNVNILYSYMYLQELTKKIHKGHHSINEFQCTVLLVICIDLHLDL